MQTKRRHRGRLFEPSETLSRALSNPSFPGLDALFVLRSTKLRKQVTSLAQPLPRLRLMQFRPSCNFRLQTSVRRRRRVTGLLQPDHLRQPENDFLKGPFAKTGLGSLRSTLKNLSALKFPAVLLASVRPPSSENGGGLLIRLRERRGNNANGPFKGGLKTLTESLPDFRVS